MSLKGLKISITVFVLVVSAFFLFFRLGHYALWDDEADTALFAQSVWNSGDTYALLDHNLIAHTYGKELRGLYNRYIPPLPFYLAAPFVGFVPGSAFIARFPFAICGWLTVGVMFFWLWNANVSIRTWVFTSMGILGNVSLMLFSRQCRYYSPAILLTTVLAFLYFYRGDRRKILLLIPLVSLLLLASNYLCYVAAYGCLVMDYFFWGRKSRPFQYRDIVIIFIPQLILGGLLVNLYNPLGINILDFSGQIDVVFKGILFFWNLRELNSCELGVGVLIFSAPLFYFFHRDKRLLQGIVAIVTYCFIIALFSPHPEGLKVAVVRYLAPLIPLCIFMAVLVLEKISIHSKRLAILIAILAFSTNILHGGPWIGTDKSTNFSSIISKGQFRSTVIEFIQELVSPNKSTYRAVANWINQNVKSKDTIWIMPSYATYPLIYHAPKAIYAWQLKERSEQFSDLPEIHFKGEVSPDYMIAFGFNKFQVEVILQGQEAKGVKYIQIHQINQYWYDLIRPELFWHAFDEIQNYNSEYEAVYIYKRVQ